jgi:hypothetical protein
LRSVLHPIVIAA